MKEERLPFPALRLPGSLPELSGLPLLGNLLAFRKDRLALQDRALAEGGEVCKIRVGLFPAVLVNAAGPAHEVLVDQADAFAKSYGLSLFARPLLGRGLLTSEGSFHRKQRRMMAPAFVNRRVAEYASVFAGRTETAQARWEDGEIVDASAEMTRLTLEIVGKTLFDAEVGGNAKEVGEALTTAMETMMSSVTSMLPVPPSVPTAGNRRSRRAIDRLDRIVFGLIKERRESAVDKGDVLSMLLLAQDEDDGSTMTDRQVRDEAMTVFLAGHETTANALSWAIHLLARHPAAYDKLAAEAASVLGGRSPTLADAQRLPYALSVVKETMRLYPPAYVIGRQSTREVTVGGHTLPRGTITLINVRGMHRRPDVFPSPERFEPDRFRPEHEKTLPRHAYIPFGAGPRVCIGVHFALLEAQLVLATLAQRVRFELTPGAAPVPEPLVTLRPRGGVRVRVRRLVADRFASAREPSDPTPRTPPAVTPE